MPQKPLRSIDLVQPEVLAKFLEAREIYPDVFIAGGYLRDRLAGIEPIDLDLFTFMPIPDDRKQFIAQWGSADLGLVEKRLTGVENFGTVDFTTESSLGSAYPTQIIHIDMEYAQASWQVILKFLFGAQQIFWDPNRVGKSEEFVRDMENKTFTVTRCEHTLDVHSTVLKWYGTDVKKGYCDRFPGWKLLIPRKWWNQFAEHFESDVIQDEYVVVYGGGT